MSEGRERQSNVSSRADELSDTRHEALRIAFENGYYEVPREGTLTDIAEELDIPSSEVSERLRHGVRDVLRDSEIVDE